MQALGVAAFRRAKALGGMCRRQGAVRGRCRYDCAPFTGSSLTMRTRHDGLKNILSTVCGFCRRARHRALCLAAGGDRDGTKRPRMGRIAAALSDFVVLTEPTIPRTRGHLQPSCAMCLPLLESRTPFAVIENRREAIGFALREAKARDVVVLCGKGHETYQEIGTIKCLPPRESRAREVRAEVQGRTPPAAAKENEHEDHALPAY
ncbi:MAG: glutamate ligase domain-containing protein [Oscillibacter sp.]